MARVLGVELIVLLLLGFIIGVLGFMYWDARRELSKLTRDNHDLHRRMEESASKTKMFEYKKNLVVSDLEQLEKKHSKLATQVTDLQEQLARANSNLEAEMGSRKKEEVDAAEVQGIQDQLISDVQSCKEKLAKCEKSLSRSGAAKRIKSLEENVKTLTKQAEDCKNRAEEQIACEENAQPKPP